MSIVTFDRDQADWGSQKIYPDGTLLPFNPDKAVIHWGGHTNPGDGEANEAAVLRAWQRLHLAKQPRPWFDIGYGFGFGNTGLTFRLRGFNRQSSTLGDIDKDGIPANHEAIAFVWIGGSEYMPSSAAFASWAKQSVNAKLPSRTSPWSLTQASGLLNAQATSGANGYWTRAGSSDQRSGNQILKET